MKKFTNLTLLFLFVAQMAFAQVTGDVPFEDLPPNPGDGKCYAKCKVPDRYETVQVQKIVKAGTSKTAMDKPVYETSTERVMVKEASFKYVFKPAVYETADKQILVKAGYCTRKVTPAKYTYTQTNKRLVADAGGRWVRKKKAPNCFSENPEDCFIMCWEETPAQYAYDTDKVLVEAEKEEVTQVPAQYKTIKIRVVKTPATYEKVEIPAVYKNFTTRVLVNSNCLETRTTTTDAKYKTVSEKRLVSSGGYTDWVEILCEAKTTNSVLREVQNKLNAKGYAVGSADGIMGIRTRAQLEKYQKDNNLPVGNLNIETLKSLGVDAN